MDITARFRECVKYRDAGCILLESIEGTAFMGLHQVTNGNVCKECTYKSSCAAKVAIERAKQQGTPITSPAKTNAELAKKLGVSKRQVAKMRAAGTLSD